jgi:hypothetical protein
MFEPEKYQDVLTYQDFAPYLNQIFKMKLSEQESTDLELIEAKITGPSPFQGYRDNFWLQFRDTCGIQRSQNTYELEHPKKGSIQIFLIPYAKDAKGMYYQAVFS